MTDIPTVLDTVSAARVVGLSPSTLTKLRLSGKGPAYVKLGRRVVYEAGELCRWLEEHRRLSTSEASTPGESN